MCNTIQCKYVTERRPLGRQAENYMLVLLILEIAHFSVTVFNASKNIRRIKDILPAHRGGIRDVELHLATSEIIDQDLFNNKDVLLIDDIITTGTSAVAFTKLIMNKTKPKSLNTFVFGKTLEIWN